MCKEKRHEKESVPPKNTVEWPQPELKSRSLDLESSYPLPLGGRVAPRELGGVVWPASQNPYPLWNQTRSAIFRTLLMTWTKIQYPQFHKAIFSSSVSKNGEVNTPETSCMKRTSVHIKNIWIKQLCNHEVRDIAMAFRVGELSGLSRNGQLLLNPLAPKFHPKMRFQPLNLIFGCRDAKWALVLLKKLIFTRKIDFS